MVLIDHLDELRRCLVRIAITLGIGAVAGLIFAKPIYRILAVPMQQSLPEGAFFIATEPIEAFMAYIKVGLLTGLFFSIPFIFYYLWSFIAPALYRREKVGGVFFVGFTSFFFIGGALFGYFVVFPTSFRFFITLLSGTDIQFLPQMKTYLSFAVRLLLAFGIVFELPVLLLLLGRLGLVTADKLKKARSYSIVAIFIVAGFMTGPDVASQLLMAAPLLVLFELSVLLVRFFGKKPRSAETIQ